ncbi:sigma-70 family RNA polymerase sigma factor [uncultured Desulfobacter sp.]|uniref:sigma-70 family RNA polymerase sigma factor n=1 Tax=uncultured Desulfobacter sp. TaxID=240139 RepID=UPI002AA8B264|nr:sigma-70 family RNA polymerase sigma factor [uncultured Desulfobacter sp.]
MFYKKVHVYLILLTALLWIMPAAMKCLPVKVIEDLMKNTEQLWQRIFDIHYHNVYGFFLKRLDSPEDAADASQETFMRVVRRNGTVKLDSPAGYIWRTAKNLVKEIKRAQALSSKWMSSKVMDVDQHISQAPNPEEAMKFQNMNDDILNILNQLPPRCREVFILHRFKGLSHKQIAGKLNISPKTVENHMVNALLFFHKHLQLP